MNYKEELLNVLCAFNIASVVVYKIVRIRYSRNRLKQCGNCAFPQISSPGNFGILRLESTQHRSHCYEIFHKRSYVNTKIVRKRFNSAKITV